MKKHHSQFKVYLHKYFFALASEYYDVDANPPKIELQILVSSIWMNEELQKSHSPVFKIEEEMSDDLVVQKLNMLQTIVGSVVPKFDSKEIIVTDYQIVKDVCGENKIVGDTSVENYGKISKLKPIKRQFLEVDEVLNFDHSNNYEIVRHFNGNNFSKETRAFELYFDHTFSKTPQSITVKAIYLDFSKRIENYETLEYFEIFEIPIPKEGISKNNEISRLIKIKEDTKVLWKICFISASVKWTLHTSIVLPDN